MESSDGHLPLFELWTEALACMPAHVKTHERGWMALFQAYLHAKHAVLAVILGGDGTYMRMGGYGVVQRRGILSFPLL